nr:MAG TPA: hypothetical protein [Bacteriophage sp.]
MIYWIGFGSCSVFRVSYSSVVASSAVCPSSRIGSKSVNHTICQSFMIFFIF